MKKFYVALTIVILICAISILAKEYDSTQIQIKQITGNNSEG